MSERTILRKGYVRKAHTRRAYTRTSKSGKRVRVPATRVKKTVVKSHQIKDVGLPGKTPKHRRVLPKPAGVLSKHGYSTRKSADSRHRAIHKAVRDKSYGTVHRELVLVRTYTRNSQPTNSRIYNSDVNYMDRNRDKLKKLKKK